MKSVTITGLSIQFDFFGKSTQEAKDAARKIVNEINEAIGRLNCNPQVFGGDNITGGDVEIEESDEGEDLADTIDDLDLSHIVDEFSDEDKIDAADEEEKHLCPICCSEMKKVVGERADCSYGEHLECPECDQ